MKTETVTLENLGHGAASEMFGAELEKVVANIMDPNTKANAIRAITLKLKFRPDMNRKTCMVEISCDSKLATAVPFGSTLFVGMEQGKAVVTEYAPEQMQMFQESVEHRTESNLKLVNSKGR